MSGHPLRLPLALALLLVLSQGALSEPDLQQRAVPVGGINSTPEPAPYYEPDPVLSFLRDAYRHAGDDPFDPDRLVQKYTQPFQQLLSLQDRASVTKDVHRLTELWHEEMIGSLSHFERFKTLLSHLLMGAEDGPAPIPPEDDD